MTQAAPKLAVLLPLTLRGTSNHADKLRRLSLTLPRNAKIYILIDEDDEVYNNEDGNNLIRTSFNPIETSIQRRVAVGRVVPICRMANSLAELAYNDGCDFFVLLGDDVCITTIGEPLFMQTVVEHFQRRSLTMNQTLEETDMKHDFGCVALNDVSFPGFPTFPIVGRTHLKIFNKKYFPDEFVNQDGDSWIWEVYRPFNAC